MRKVSNRVDDNWALELGNWRVSRGMAISVKPVSEVRTLDLKYSRRPCVIVLAVLLQDACRPTVTIAAVAESAWPRKYQ